MADDLERARHERVQHKEERLRRHEDCDGIRHAIPRPAAMHEQRDGRVTGEQPAPEQQGAFLAAPPGRDLIGESQRSIAVRGNSGKTEVVSKECVEQNCRGERDEKPDGIDSTVRAQSQQRFAPPGDGSDDGVHGEIQCQQDCQRGNIFHMF